MSLDQRFRLAAPESHHFPKADKRIETCPPPLIDTVLLIVRLPAQNKRTAIAILLTMACLLVVAGCGDGNDSDDEATAGKESPPVSNTEGPATEKAASNTAFVSEADAICSKGKQRVETEFASYLEENNLQKIGASGESPAETEAHEIQAIETIAIPTLRKQLSELEGLEAPGGNEENFTAYLAAVDQGIEKGEQDPQLLFGSPEKVFGESDTLAGELGFKVCGNR